MGWVTGKDNGGRLPLGTDELVGCEAAQDLEALGMVIDQQEGLQVVAELGRALV